MIRPLTSAIRSYRSLFERFSIATRLTRALAAATGAINEPTEAGFTIPQPFPSAANDDLEPRTICTPTAARWPLSDPRAAADVLVIAATNTTISPAARLAPSAM